MQILRFNQFINEGVTQFIKPDTEWEPYASERNDKKYFTRKNDDSEYPPIYGEDELELIKKGYGIEHEFRASRYTDEKAKDAVNSMKKDFDDVKYIKTYPDEFGGLYRFYVKPKKES